MFIAFLLKFKGPLLTASAVLAVLVGAYSFGGRKAEQAADLKGERSSAENAEAAPAMFT